MTKHPMIVHAMYVLQLCVRQGCVRVGACVSGVSEWGRVPSQREMVWSQLSLDGLHTWSRDEQLQPRTGRGRGWGGGGEGVGRGWGWYIRTKSTQCMQSCHHSHTLTHPASFTRRHRCTIRYSIAVQLTNLRELLESTHSRLVRIIGTTNNQQRPTDTQTDRQTHVQTDRRTHTHTGTWRIRYKKRVSDAGTTSHARITTHAKLPMGMAITNAQTK